MFKHTNTYVYILLGNINSLYIFCIICGARTINMSFFKLLDQEIARGAQKSLLLAFKCILN